MGEWDGGKKDHLEQELADVSIYCLRLADVVGIQNLGLAACRMGDNDADEVIDV